MGCEFVGNGFVSSDECDYKKIISSSRKYVKELTKNLDLMHGYQHSLFVANTARKIAKTRGLNGNLAFIAGMLHDIGRSTYSGKWVKETLEVNHGTIGAKMAEEFLLGLGMGAWDVHMISEAISSHVKIESPKSPLGEVIWDADKLWSFCGKIEDSWSSEWSGYGLSDSEIRKKKREYRSFCYNSFFSAKAKNIADSYLKLINDYVDPAVVSFDADKFYSFKDVAVKKYG